MAGVLRLFRNNLGDFRLAPIRIKLAAVGRQRDYDGQLESNPPRFVPHTPVCEYTHISAHAPRPIPKRFCCGTPALYGSDLNKSLKQTLCLNAKHLNPKTRDFDLNSRSPSSKT